MAEINVLDAVMNFHLFSHVDFPGWGCIPSKCISGLELDIYANLISVF